MEVCPGGPSSESILEPHTEDGLCECHLKSHKLTKPFVNSSSRSLQLLMMAGNCIAERKVRVGDFFLKTSFHQVLLGSVSVQILQL